MNGCHLLRNSLVRAMLVGATLATVTVPPAFGHDVPPTHGCSAPSRPANDQDDGLWQRYLDDVDGFRACISDFVEANQSAARAHNDAANAATGDWNRFVKGNLNVPEDYPWPPDR